MECLPFPVCYPRLHPKITISGPQDSLSFHDSCQHSFEMQTTGALAQPCHVNPGPSELDRWDRKPYDKQRSHPIPSRAGPVCAFPHPGLPPPGLAMASRIKTSSTAVLKEGPGPSSSVSHPFVSVASASPFCPLDLLPEQPVCLSPAGAHSSCVTSEGLKCGAGGEEEGATRVFRLQERACKA